MPLASSSNDDDDGVNDIFVTLASSQVTEHVLLILVLSADVAVIVQDPALFHVTVVLFPLVVGVVTVATVVSEDDQFIVLFAAFAGSTVAIIDAVLPPATVNGVVGSNVIPVTAIVAALQVTEHVAVLLVLPAAVAVIVHLPAFFHLTVALSPLVVDDGVTVAMEASEDSQFIVLSVASPGDTVARI